MNLAYGESKNPNDFKVLSRQQKLSISDVQDYLTKGDNLVEDGDFEKESKTTIKKWI